MDEKTGQVHNATNEVSLTKEDINGMKYLAVHVKGNAWYDRLTK